MEFELIQLGANRLFEEPSTATFISVLFIIGNLLLWGLLLLMLILLPIALIKYIRKK